MYCTFFLSFHPHHTGKMELGKLQITCINMQTLTDTALFRNVIGSSYLIN
uniref:Uncharacterized protein n=1 Tax=Setaria italica TaxID=4555 RepID=K3ZZ21_SETIT